jgi:hypothetical protein
MPPMLGATPRAGLRDPPALGNIYFTVLVRRVVLSWTIDGRNIWQLVLAGLDALLVLLFDFWIAITDSCHDDNGAKGVPLPSQALFDAPSPRFLAIVRTPVAVFGSTQQCSGSRP